MINNKGLHFLAMLGLNLFISVLGAQIPENGNDVLKHYYAAIGGENAIKNVTDYRSNGVFVARGKKNPWTVQGSFAEIKSSDQHWVSVLDYSGKRFLIIYEPEVVRFFPPEASDYVFMENDRNRLSEPIPFSKIISVDSFVYDADMGHYIVGITSADTSSWTVSFDVNSFLPFKATTNHRIGFLNKDCLYTFKFSDYREVDGVMFPYHIQKEACDLGIASYLVGDYEVNLNIDRQLFAIDMQTYNPDKYVQSLFPAYANQKNLNTTGGLKGETKILSDENKDAYGNKMMQLVTDARDKLKSAVLDKPLKPFKATTFVGRPFSEKDFLGKVTLIDFWATWCKPCIEMLPKLSALEKSLKPHGFQIIGISVDNDLNALRSFLNNNPNSSWTQIHDNDMRIAESFKVGAYPTYFIIDREGICRDVYVGADQEEKMFQKIRALTKVE